jgi:hypothetical protein
MKEDLILCEVGHQRTRVLELRIVQHAPEHVPDAGTSRAAQELVRGRAKVENIAQAASTPLASGKPAEGGIDRFACRHEQTAGAERL